MLKTFTSISNIILILSFSFMAYAEKEELSSAQVKKYKNGIFEVVTLKLEDNAIYKEEFPHDLIPFHLRKDKYHSLGTSFLIKDNTFVSAAHVFNIGHYSLLSKNYAVRDSKGNIFKIKNVEKYSNYRDLIQFSVEGDTSKYHKFAFGKNYEEGDIVYAAGNALGEGVIFRKGSLTSFTYEPIDGKWKDIRYSAAASPGNSGGPLLNLDGEVVGIVTKKSSSENLNYALPIEEFNHFTSDTAEFYTTQMAEVEATQQLRYSWRFSAKLPKDIMALRALAEKSFYERFVNARVDFVTKFEKSIFPKHSNVGKYLKNQKNSDMLSSIDINGNGEWLLFKAEDTRQIKISKDQTLYYSKSNKFIGNYQFDLDKPKGKKLSEFIKDKKYILDTFFTSMQWNRNIANTPVYITSYGKPVYEEQYEDKYGRVWQMATWNDQYSNRAIMIYCLPTPSGVSCDLVSASRGWLPVQKAAYKDNLHRIMLSYSAKLKEWKEFIELPNDIIPKHFRDSKLNISENKVDFQIGEFSGSLPNLKLTGDSNLYVAIEIDPDHINELMIGNFSFTPNLNEDGTYYVSKFYNQGEHASDSYKDFWTKFTMLKSPYNFEVINEGKQHTKYMNLGANKKSPKNTSADINKIGYLAVCKLQSEVKLSEFNQSCDTFINGLH
ncbi:MAG: trypsin-like peptidase domain-containing protein [Alteromonadaceae bacterium]|nr:trypsin-like peptidase domain-containing protein [Alteromonadaceae bacterium]